MADLDVARTATELWMSLQRRYGLNPNGYDRDLVEDIRTALGLPDAPMPSALRRQGVTIEALLHAVLLSLQPLAAMLSDLLRLYERAQATMADRQNLHIVPSQDSTPADCSAMSRRCLTRCPPRP